LFCPVLNARAQLGNPLVGKLAGSGIGRRRPRARDKDGQRRDSEADGKTECNEQGGFHPAF
jgi:hypothetical protein